MNQIKTSENPKRKRKRLTKKQMNKKPIKKKKVCIKKANLKGRHLIPGSYLDTDVVELYVKKQFLIEAENRQDKYNPYNLIGSQVAQQTLKKLDESYNSFFKKKKNGDEKCKPPYYLKENRYVLIFQKTSFSIKTVNNRQHVKLSVGQTMKKILKKVDATCEGFLWFEVPTNLVEKNITINEVEITPCNDQSIMTISYKYDITVPPQKERIDEEGYRIASVDLGMINTMTIFSLYLLSTLIYKGTYILYINKVYKELIEEIYQPALARAQSKNERRNIKTHINRLWRKRNYKIKDYFDKISCDFINECVKAKIDEIIIGYNDNWKQKVNMGFNNDKFYKIPYGTMVSMIKYKAEQQGILVTKQYESYTSKCDALNWEKVCEHKRYTGRRIRRGLFSSKTHKLVNADINGAINIMRKGLEDYPVLLNELKRGLRDNDKLICNPIVKKIHYDTKDENRQEEAEKRRKLKKEVFLVTNKNPKTKRERKIQKTNDDNRSYRHIKSLFKQYV